MSVKECTKCKVTKNLEEFSKESRRKDGRRSQCKICVKEYRKQVSTYENERSKRWRQENQEKISEYRNRTRDERLSYQRNYFVINRDHINQKSLAYKRKHRERLNEKGLLYTMRRRARKNKLPDSFSDYDKLEVLNYFNNSCCLTGSKEYQWDHVIPIATGNGGTIKENMIPLRADLNFSKKASNIFEWFDRYKHVYNLDSEKFNDLITYLARINKMPIDEYREYVYKCHDDD